MSFLIILVFVIGANSPWVGGALLVPSILIPMGLYLIKRRIHKLEGRKLEAKFAKHLLDRMPLHLDEIPWEKQQLRHLVGRLSYLDLEPNTLTLARLNEDPNSFAFDKRYQGKGAVAKAHRKLATLQTRVPKKWRQQVEPDQLLRRRLVKEKKHLEKRLEHLEAMADVYSVRQHSLETVGFESKADFEKRGKLPIDEERNQKRLDAIEELEASLEEEVESINKRLDAIDVMFEHSPIFIKEELERQLEALYQEGNRIGERFAAIDQEIAEECDVAALSIEGLRAELFRVKGVIVDYNQELRQAVNEDQIADLEEEIARGKAVERTLFCRLFIPPV